MNKWGKSICLSFCMLHTHTHAHTSRHEAMTVTQQAGVHHLCIQRIANTHSSFIPLVHTVYLQTEFGAEYTHTQTNKHSLPAHTFYHGSLYLISLFFYIRTHPFPGSVTEHHQLSMTQWTLPHPSSMSPLEVSHVETLFHIPHPVNV